MKKVMMATLATVAMAFTGCTPTAEEINKTATAIGYAAGLVANKTKVDNNARNAIVAVLNDVRQCVPSEGQSFVDAWTPVIKSKVEELVKAGKIDAITGELVTSVALMAAKGVDYIFDVRFPKAKQYEELVAAGASGAIDGFLTVFKPVNHSEDDCQDCVARGNAKKDYDKEAFEWFKKNL